MRLLRNRSMAFYLSFVLLLTTALGSSTLAAFADTRPIQVTITGGGLTESLSNNKVNLDVDSKVKQVTYSLPITVTDARGAGNGWNLLITSTRFSITAKGKDQLPASASHITMVGVVCSANSTCTKPINGISYPVLVPAGSTPPAPVKFFNAGVSTGLGKFLLTMMVNVSIPHDAEPGIYRSIVILTIANGP